ncbi:hypothetical protein SAMN06296386_11649 [Lachnospiraceae bacterium]|nr:hypothetical protein SAMN06296386_11649 [Lachnospiraceae bacterium]
MYFSPYMFHDPTYILVLIGLILSMAASAKVKSTFAKYSRVRSSTGMTGAEVASQILRRNNVLDVQVRHIGGSLTDNFNPMNKTVNLSDSTYGSSSVASIGVAAHECGHVLQHAEGYLPLTLRATILPVANIGSRVSIPMIFLGILLGAARGGFGQSLITIGIWLFSFAVAFQIVTLPVEFNASRRALAILERDQVLYPEELKMAKEVLTAAALTYVAAAASSALQLLRLVILFGGNRRDD